MRFIIHDHITKDRHYDLMIETGDDLLITWRIMPADLEMLIKGNEVKISRILDHEKYFLDFEGDLSSGKGSVSIYDQGNSRIIKNLTDTFVFELSGQIFQGRIELFQVKNELFKIQYFPKHSSL